MASRRTLTLLLTVLMSLGLIVIVPARAGTEPSPFMPSISLESWTDRAGTEPSPFRNAAMQGQLEIVVPRYDMPPIVEQIYIPPGGMINVSPILPPLAEGYTVVFSFHADLINSGVDVGTVYAFLDDGTTPPENDPLSWAITYCVPSPVPTPIPIVLWAYASPPTMVGSGMISWVPGTVDIQPDTLNLKSNGEWITAYIESAKPDQIDLSTVKLKVPTDLTLSVDPSAPTTIGDYDVDGKLDLMVKFTRVVMVNYLGTIDTFDDGTGISEEVTLTITWKYLGSDITYSALDTIRVIKPGK